MKTSGSPGDQRKTKKGRACIHEDHSIAMPYSKLFAASQKRTWPISKGAH